MRREIAHPDATGDELRQRRLASEIGRAPTREGLRTPRRSAPAVPPLDLLSHEQREPSEHLCRRHITHRFGQWYEARQVDKRDRGLHLAGELRPRQEARVLCEMEDGILPCGPRHPFAVEVEDRWLDERGESFLRGTGRVDEFRTGQTSDFSRPCT